MPNVILQNVGLFIQATLTTNTPKVLVDQFANIWRDFKRWRSVACATSIILVGGGGVPLFILVPEIYDYFGPIVHEVLPFVGDVGEAIGVGFIGFWISGAVAYNVGKFAYREFSAQVNGHTNAEYAITNEKVEAIIDANPHIYSYEDAPQAAEDAAAEGAAEVEVVVDEAKAANANRNRRKKTDIFELKSTLEKIRDEIDKYRGDGTERHDTLKNILLSALRSKDLLPLIEKSAIEKGKREIRIKYLEQLNAHLEENKEVFENTTKSLKELNQSQKIYPLYTKRRTHEALDCPRKQEAQVKIENAIERQREKALSAQGYNIGSDEYRQALGL